MPDLPTGTVTFLLTDVEGSTRLWEQDPAAMRAALVQHDAIVEFLTEQHRGVVVRPRGEGDSRFCVFARATDAVAAAAAIQGALHAEGWPTPAPLRVRVALHTGEADLRDGDYYGSAVNRCARLRALAHGGQTLLSRTTADLVRDGLRDGLGLRDLGERRLRDLSAPERVYQLAGDGLPDDFPPPRSLDAVPNNLPVEATPLVGRARELAELQAALLRPETRLLTLVGPGGAGKTRLALQAAAEALDGFPDGVFAVALGAVTDPALVLPSVAQTLGVRESEGRAARDALVDHLRPRRLLLVLDNLEQLPDAAPAVADLLGACRELRVLATSRAALHLYGEKEYAVPPLGLPPPEARGAAAVGDAEAVRLFVARVRDVRTDFALTDANAAAVAGICRRLDGLPLALELAAARAKVLPPEALLARLDRGLSLLTGGARDVPERQRTLRGAIAWSHDLLDGPEQRLFRRLGVFAGGCALEAVEAVCDRDGDLAIDPLDGVASLADKSLLLSEDAGGEARYRMLATVREYALEQLAASGELAALRARHADYMLGVAETAERELNGPGQRVWLDRLAREHDDLRAALGWCLDVGDAARGLRLAGALGLCWYVRGVLMEGGEWLARVLELPDGSVPPATRARALEAAAHLAHGRGEETAAIAYLEQALTIARRLNDPERLAHGSFNLGSVLKFVDPAAARPPLTEALATFRARGDRAMTAFGLHHLAQVEAAEGNLTAARAMMEEAAELRAGLGAVLQHGSSLKELGWIAREQGDVSTARSLFLRSREMASAGGWGAVVSDALRGLAELALDEGDRAAASASLREALRLERAHRGGRRLAQLLGGAAGLAAADGRAEQALRLAGAADRQWDRTGAPRPAADGRHLDRWLAPALAALGEARAARTRAAGRSITLEEAVAEALAEPPGEPAGGATTSQLARPGGP